MRHIQALFIVLNKVECLNEILAGFVEVGVRGATVLDSQGMANIIVSGDNHHISLFRYFKTLMEDTLPYNKTIFTVLENEELVEQAVAVVQKIIGDVPKPGVGFMFSLPIAKTYPMGLTE